MLEKVVVVGGGVVGCAVLRELRKYAIPAVMLEKNKFPLSEASGGNSGIVCTGFDAPRSSLEFKLIRQSIQLLPQVLKELNVPHKRTGSLIVAQNDSPNHMDELTHMLETNLAIGDSNVRIVDKMELKKMEPHLNPSMSSALFIPHETLVDSCLYGIALLNQALVHGAELLTSTRIHSLTYSDESHRYTIDVATKDQSLTIQASHVINCAGLYADEFDLRFGLFNQSFSKPAFKVTPRRGQYLVLAPNKTSKFSPSQPIINKPIQPIPTQYSKGVYVFPSVHGNILIGPTATDQESKTDRTPCSLVKNTLLDHGVSVVPELMSHYHVVDEYVGLRTATQHRDYQIHSHPSFNWITVGGIRSTGVTASLGIAHHVIRLLKDQCSGRFPISRKLLPTPLPDDLKGAMEQNEEGTFLHLDASRLGVPHPLALNGLSLL